ncbi:MAG: hypothetical protein WBE30_05370 [Candidatus Cybelea sp.]
MSDQGIARDGDRPDAALHRVDVQHEDDVGSTGRAAEAERLVCSDVARVVGDDQQVQWPIADGQLGGDAALGKVVERRV